MAGFAEFFCIKLEKRRGIVLFARQFLVHQHLFLFTLMKKQLLLLLLAFLSWGSVQAQIPDGSIAPDFNATDLNGNSYNLYTLLEQGKTVFLDISATWCGPCWNYHNSHALKDIWDEYGPDGTNEAFVFFAEGDASTNLNCLYGPAGCVGGTQGNWVAGTPYPIIHQQGPSIASAYQINYYPSIFIICPYDKKVYETGQLPASSLWNMRNDKCAPPAIDIIVNNVNTIKCYGANTGAIDISVAGGVPPYTYAWSNGATTQDLNNIPAGSYTVTVTSLLDIVAISDAIEVEGPSAPLTLMVENTTPVGCNGILGSATVFADGGWSANYDYKWQNGQFGETAFNLNVGNHIVSVTDDNNCTVSITVNMAPAVYPTATIAEPGVVTCSQPNLVLDGSGSSSGPEISYQWFASGGGNIVSGGTTATPTVNAGGNYTIQVTNIETTCASFASKPVAANLDAPTANAGPSKQISCADPQTTLEGSGSSGANFSYLWTATDGGNIVSGGTTLAPLVNAGGTYTLQVTNSTNGCTQISATTVTGTPPPTLATTNGTLNCVVSSITLNTNTNAASPTFTWTGPNGFSSSAQNPTVNESGAYQVVVTDSITSCTNTATANVSADTNAPGATAMGNTLTCVINSVVITGATPDTNATFAWTGPNGFQSNLQNPTVGEAGAYNLVVTDTLNGCTSSAIATVELNDTPPTASAVSPGNLNCNIQQLQLNGTGSSQGNNISYAWTANNGGNIVSGENTQTPLVDAAGTYAILVTNADNGCTQTASVAVVQSPSVVASIANQSDVRCNGESNGAATAAGTGGNGTLNFAWSNGETTETINGLSAGTYVVVVTDADNCSASGSVIINQPTLLLANASTTPQSAFGENDGTATANPGGGTPGYNYAWNNGETTQSISGLAPGNYSVVITDANGCTVVQTVTVNSFNCFLAVSTTSSNLTCNGANNGTAVVLVTAGADPMNFEWSNGETTQAVANLAAGTYTVNITDGNNCPAELTVNISQPALLLSNTNSTAESATGANDGMATANPTGGTGPYTFAWSNGEQTQAITNLAPGTYTVVVTDANGCTHQQSVEVASFLCAISPQSTIVNVNCPGASNGSVTISLVGGEAPFNYTWSNGGTTATINNLAGGTYTVDITDVNGCAVSATATVNEPLPFTAWEVETTNPLCPNEAAGSATATISGATGPYAFVWSNGTSGNTIANMLAGSYTVQVTDANGCQSSTTVAIVATDSEAPIVSVQDATLALGPDGTAQVSLADLSAQLSDNCGIASTSISPQEFDCAKLGQQSVTLTVTDLSGNTATAVASVNVVDNIVPVLSCPADIVACSYDNVVNYASPVAEDNCLLAGNGVWDVAGPASGSSFPEAETTVTYTYTDASGNAGSCSFKVTVTSAVLFTNITVSNDQNGQQIGTISITVEGGTAPYQYEWINETGNVIGTTEDITGLGEGIYRVQVTDANGCVYAEEDIKLQNTSSVKEPEWLSGVSLQPNPTNGITNVVFSRPVAATLEISVVDATGRVLLSDISEQENTVRIDCSNLPGGVYWLRFRTGQEIGVRKLVVSK